MPAPFQLKSHPGGCDSPRKLLFSRKLRPNVGAFYRGVVERCFFKIVKIEARGGWRVNFARRSVWPSLYISVYIYHIVILPRTTPCAQGIIFCFSFFPFLFANLQGRAGREKVDCTKLNCATGALRSRLTFRSGV